MSRPEQSQFGLRRSIAFSLVLICGFLLLAELAVRGWAYYLRDDAEKYDVATGTFVLIPGKHRSMGRFAEINSDGLVGPELLGPDPELWRIATLGDSCTYGGGWATDTYPSVLQELLDERPTPGHRYEVVNAAISGLNSELALRRLESKVLPLEPDVITLYVGWNDLMKFDPLAQDAGQRWSGVARVLDQLWLVKGLRKLLFFHVRPVLRPPRTGPESRTGRFAEFRPSHYEQNLEEMIARVRAGGAQPVLLNLPSALRPGMTTEDLRRARVIFPYFPSAYGVGDFLDLIAAYNASIRRVAEGNDVPLVDLVAAFEKLDDLRPYFWDTMHTSIRGRGVIARALYQGLEREGLLDRP